MLILKEYNVEYIFVFKLNEKIVPKLYSPPEYVVPYKILLLNINVDRESEPLNIVLYAELLYSNEYNFVYSLLVILIENSSPEL